MMTEHDAACAGWYYDPLHQQPVYLFWDHTTWRARFVWQNPHAEALLTPGGGLSVADDPLTRETYQRLQPLGQADAKNGADVSGLRELYGVRRLVRVKPIAGGQGLFIQAPTLDDHDHSDRLCQTIWLSDDEIPSIIHALQARQHAVLEAGWDAQDPKGSA